MKGRVCEVRLGRRGGSFYGEGGRGMRSCCPITSQIVGPPRFGFYLSNGKLNPGTGFDFVFTNHVRFSSIIFRNFMSRLFSCFLSHSFIPNEMLYDQNRSIVKNNSMCKTNSDNYRPIMTSSVILNSSVRDICLKINVKKLMYILLKCRKPSIIESSVYIFAEPLNQVFELKYLAIIITDDISISKNMDRVMNIFVRQYNSMFHKFNFIDRNILFFSCLTLIHHRFMA